MSIQEYNNCYEHFLSEKVDRFVQEKYGDNDFVLCWFDLYQVDIDRKSAHSYEPENVELKKEDYALLLTLLVEHPNLTFQELPLHISIDLYKQLLVFLRFHVLEKLAHPLLPEARSNPIGIEMSSLQGDAEEIFGERSDVCSILVQSYTYRTKFQEMYVSTWMGLMEVSINYVKDQKYIYSKYGMIDLKKVKNLLGLSTCEGLSSALSDLCKEESSSDSDIHWIVRWLDRHGIKYVYAEDVA